MIGGLAGQKRGEAAGDRVPATLPALLERQQKRGMITVGGAPR